MARPSILFSAPRAGDVGQHVEEHVHVRVSARSPAVRLTVLSFEQRADDPPAHSRFTRELSRAPIPRPAGSPLRGGSGSVGLQRWHGKAPEATSFASTRVEYLPPSPSCRTCASPSRMSTSTRDAHDI